MIGTVSQQEEDAVETLTYPKIEMEPTTIEPMVSPERTTPLRPSEAIRIGRLEVPLKSPGSLIVKDHNGNILGACALGAMWVGYDGAESVAAQHTGGSYWWPLNFNNPVVPFPCGCNEPPTLAQAVVAHVNDSHIAVDKPKQTWTEEKLATWMDTLPLT